LNEQNLGHINCSEPLKSPKEAPPSAIENLVNMDELKFINFLQKNVKAGKSVVEGIGDDAAVLEYTKDKYLLFAADMLVEGVHFHKGTDPFSIGWKAVAVNISDIAAMGGIPKYILMSVGVPKNGSEPILKQLLKGAKAICGKFGVAIVGGDTNSSEKIVIDVSIIGEVEKKRLARRDGAKVSDPVFVTGALGNGREKHLGFIPRVTESRRLGADFKVNAMIDISDGLFIDLTRICRASNVGVCIYEDLIPVKGDRKNIKKAVNYGEDFELLFTVPEAQAVRLRKSRSLHATEIGRIIPEAKGLNFVTASGSVGKIKPLGYMHF
jgi:thiamine-monophosphate kinase